MEIGKYFQFKWIKNIVLSEMNKYLIGMNIINNKVVAYCHSYSVFYDYFKYV